MCVRVKVQIGGVRHGIPEKPASDRTKRLELFDAAGRRVRCPVDAVLPAGPHEVVRDGRGKGGEALASRTYCCRLQAAGRLQTCKVTLAR